MDIHANAHYSIPLQQKIRLALGVYAIYWPIRIYVNHDDFGIHAISRDWLIWIVELILTTAYFTLWLVFTERIEQQLKHSFLSRSFKDHSLTWKILMLVIAALLAVGFNCFYGAVWMRLDSFLHEPDFRHFAEDYMRKRASTSPLITIPIEVRHKAVAKVNNGLVVMALLSAYYLAALSRGHKQLEELRVNSEQLKREATQVQLSALKNQVNPHFLFNSLSILSSLVEIDTKLSVQFIAQLSRAFRYVLEQRDTEKVLLKTEMDFLKSYIFLLNIRFEDKLVVSTHVDENDSMRFHIAPLTLQLLVENAVKHNQMSMEQPLKVTIFVEGDYLVVKNPLQLRPQREMSTGMGLQNIINRYRLLVDRPVIVDDQPGYFTVKIPLL
ncbi:histidine kinase [Chitinophaga skermanii]|uniref:Histidine kinase n=1 Tax=Chitinophaga skermanii TaxID=331697 RepID=A0A327QV74_9BACT|nr:histidine kinase [Chitinophaga skermanii]RAJ08211.1 histidine kinase [Chitinophaga skermanii]